MNISKNKIIKVLLMLVFLSCMIYANFYAIRKMSHVAVELDFYDRLSAAYDIGGAEGLKTELNKVIDSNKFPHESILAKDFEIKSKDSKNLGAFLNEKIIQAKKRISLIKNLRTTAIVAMFIIFGWRIVVNFLLRKKSAPGK